MWTGRHVRALRDAIRKTQLQLAEDLGCAQRTVSFWEGRPDSTVSAGFQARLDSLLLGADHGVKGRFFELIGDPDVDRRNFLASTAAVGMSMLPGEGKPVVTVDAIEHLRTSVHSAMLLDDKLGSGAARPIIEAQASTCVALLRDCPPSLQRELHVLAGEATVSRAWSAWDQGNVRHADALFRSAYRHAEESGDTDIAVGILCHRTRLAIKSHQYERAADLADGVLVIPVNDGRMSDYRRLCAAMAFAARGRNRDAWAQLGRVTDDYEVQTTPDESYCYYQSRWTTQAWTARCFALSGQLNAAADAVEAMLPSIPSYAKRDRALCNLGLADFAAVIDPDRACAAAHNALDLVRGNVSPRVRETYAETRANLESWASSRAVRRLDETAAGVLA